MAASRAMFGRIIGRVRRFESLTGRRISKSALASLMEAELTVSQARAGEEAQLEFAKEREATRTEEVEREFEFRETTQAREEELRAEANKKIAAGARFQGGVNIATLGIQAAQTETGKKATSAIFSAGKEVTKRLFAPAAPALPGAAGAALAPAAAALPGAAGAALAPAAGAGATAAGVGVKAVAGKVLPLLGAASIGSFIGEKVGGKAGGIIGGAGAGFLAGGPVGAIVGGVVGAVTGGKVICTELWRQGFIPTNVLALDSQHARDNIDKATMQGYWLWAKPVVKVMQKSKIVTWIIKPFGVSWAYHMAHQLDNSIPDSWLGKWEYKIGVPICRWLGQKEGK